MKIIKSLEFGKGVAIFSILFSNIINFWLNYDYELRYIYGFIITWLEIFGTSLYIILFSMSIIFTLKKKMGCIPEKENTNKLFKQAIILILLGILYNLILNPTGNFFLNMWGWNVLIFLGFAQIFCYFAFKLVRWARLAIGLTIILATPYIRGFLYFGMNDNPLIKILYFILVSPYLKYPVLPYASLWFFSTVFGELIYESILLESKLASISAVRSIIKYGFVFIVIGLLYPLIQLLPFIGSPSYSPDIYPFFDALPILKGSSFVYIPGVPLILIRGSLENIFFILGIALLFFGFVYYLIDMRETQNHIFNVLVFYGKISITLLLIQYIFLPLFNQSLNISLFLTISVIYIFLLGIIMYLWKKYGKWILTLEWIIRKSAGKNIDELL